MSQDNPIDCDWKRYALKNIGHDWFIEYNESLTRLRFLSGVENVRLDQNVIFAGDDLYQIKGSVNGSIGVRKIEDANHSLFNDKVKKKQRNECDTEKEITRSEDYLKLNCTLESVDHKGYSHSFDRYERKDVSEKRTSDLENMSDMVSSIEIKGRDSKDTAYDSRPGKLRQRLGKLFQKRAKVTTLSTVPQETKTMEGQQKSSSERSMGHSREESAVFEVLALFSYEALHDDDVKFEEGDVLEVYSELTANNFEWYLARNILTGQKGYIPKNYVSVNDNSAYCQRWYHNIRIREVRRLFKDPHLPVGTFLVLGDFGFVLCVKSSEEGGVKNYKIRRSDNGGYYISPKDVFDSMPGLIANYRHAANGMCCKLTEAYPKCRPIVHLRNIQVNRHTVNVFGRFREGLGIYGNTHSGKFMKTLDVAVKILKHNVLKIPKENFLEEIRLLERMRHDKLVQILAVCLEAEPILIMSEFIFNGSLLDYLRCETVRASLWFDTLTDIAAQIAEGMAYLEENNFVHGDLRAAKCLVGENNIVKVSGHGLFNLFESDLFESDNIYQMSNHLPTKWFAPEVYSSRRFNVKSDVWSFGVLLYEVITLGCVPYPGMSGREVIDEVPKGFRMRKPNSGPIECPDSYYEMMLQCWQISQERRPTFAYLQHFFEDFTVCTEPFKVSI